MEDKAKVKGHPLKVFVFSLVFSYFVGEYFSLYLTIPLIINILGLFLIIIFFSIFLISARMFFLHSEQLPPSTSTEKIIKTGIYLYTRNPIYLSFVGFQIGMFLLFENIVYFISSMCLFYWLHRYAILPEEEYLKQKFGKQYERYQSNVPRWLLY